ncbi:MULTISPECIES: peptidoglycan DD-metalloendopeptidase family protein [Moorena]|uniref:Membrane protein, putative metalloendopeptidase n=1 Tax=Moorena producens 3L TaxID=489825 RepID=F4XMR7_9CYAN|nr:MULTISPECIES: peptidoglycan DD-metalloendopeptidase family protein [Moorena]EGJ33976.1 membrane protein, putative metalloendopeptidase [Moorena producens 3L]NEP29996.1 peptidoglycan DD-metalloendopeptidase family protein [Moorena sp. SIO3B2]NEP65455.1 peptidoglycan DD-metalloendopeptidase family protein [Moorena sp. SIO3A5]NER85676.1 peptidoglycan DD-metalloendopeptidase family protein [Moorena sp. SIO3A2]NES42732.1 peptidoglycan DD-metalloendopeptidase family protein [Moorena sp. SIO2C4]
MKGTLTDKVNHVPTCAAESSDSSSKLPASNHAVGAVIPLEVNRKARTSAAMIGLAISMGASGLLLPQQGDEAMAFEPVAPDPSGTNLPAAEFKVTAVSSPSLLNPAKEGQGGVASKPASPPELAIRQSRSRSRSVAYGESVAYGLRYGNGNFNKLKTDDTLPVARKSTIGEVKGTDVKASSKSEGVEPKQLLASAPVSKSGNLSTDASQAVSDKTNNLLKARQDLALKRLQKHRNRLSKSLVQLRSEEFNKSYELASATLGSSPHTLPPAVLKPEGSVTQTSQPIVTVPTAPATLPQPRPKVAVSPALTQSTRSEPLPVVIPVPTPETTVISAVKPSVFKVSTPRIASATTKVTTEQLNVPQPVVVGTRLSSTGNSFHQVKAGETLDSIARSYGLSRSELVLANQLDNPHLIEINQQLKIPQVGTFDQQQSSVTLLSSNSPKSEPWKPAIGRPLDLETTISVKTSTSRDQVTSVSIEEKPKVKPVTETILAQSTSDSGLLAQATSSIENQPLESINSQRNSYVEKLRADILKMREEIRDNKTSPEESKPINLGTPTNEPVADPSDKESKSVEITPQWNPENNQATGAKESELLLPQPPTAPQVPIAIPRPQPPRKTRRSSIAIPVPPPEVSQPRRIAVAPAPPERFNPMIRIPVGKPVSPGVPPLSTPDMYLPDSPNRFNGYIWPSNGVITSGYGRRWGRMHKGIDIAAPIGTPIMAAAPGVVVSAGWNSGGYGKLVEIKHPDGSLTLYAHNSRIFVRRGQQVGQGQRIAAMGSTGYSTGPHLHFEVHPRGRGAANPIAYLPTRR